MMFPKTAPVPASVCPLGSVYPPAFAVTSKVVPVASEIFGELAIVPVALSVSFPREMVVSPV